RGAALVQLAQLVEAGARAARPLGDRQHHDHLPGGAARRAEAPVRVGRARRGERAQPVSLGDASVDQPGDPVLGRHRRDRGAPVLHAGLCGGHDRPRRPGRRLAVGPRLPGAVHAVLPGPALPAGLPLLQHGLRRRAGGAAARRVAGRHVHHPAPRRAADPLPGGGALMEAAYRRRRLLIFVAEHAVLIALAIGFLAPLVFSIATALMTNQQALSPDLWPNPVTWNFDDVFHRAPLLRYAANTFLYAGLSTVGVV